MTAYVGNERVDEIDVRVEEKVTALSSEHNTELSLRVAQVWLCKSPITTCICTLAHIVPRNRSSESEHIAKNSPSMPKCLAQTIQTT